MANLSHSRRSIMFMESMAKFCTLLAIIPYYNFDKKQIERKKLYKSYTVAIVFLLISTTIFTEYNSWNIFYIKEDTLLFGLTKTLQLNSLILFLMTSLGSAFWNLERWEHFFKSFAYLEDYFNTEACLESNYFKHLCSQFIISNVCLLSHLPFVLISVKYNALLMTLQLCLFFVFYIKFTKSLVIFNLTLAMKCKYQDLNSCLCEGCFGMGSDIRKTILRVSNFYGKMNGIVNDFNKLFGWELLLNITHTFVLVMICFNHINWYFFKKAHETLNVSATVVLCLISVGLLSMVRLQYFLFRSWKNCTFSSKLR